MVDSIADQFPHPELTPLPTDTEKPNHASLKLLHKELNANAMAITSDLGSGRHGHLALTVSAATYLVLADAEFVPPEHPGPAPIHAAAPTTAQITKTNRQFAADTLAFKVYASIESSLKKLLLIAVPSTYIDELSNDVLGYANTTTLDILTHLDTTYGTITSDNLDLNLKNLHQEWSTKQPMEDLWKQIRMCRLFADGIDPMNFLQMLLSTNGKYRGFVILNAGQARRPSQRLILCNFTSL